MTYDVVIVGGGIVGLATGMKILKSRPDLKLAILEKESQLAKHQTANNFPDMIDKVMYCNSVFLVGTGI